MIWKKCVLMTFAAMVCVSSGNGQEVARASPPSARSGNFIPFIVAAEADILNGNYGVLMQHPAHLHGTADEAQSKLMGLLDARRRVSQSQPATIFICRSHQKEMLRRFAPVIERIVVNPFVGFGDASSDDGPVWPGAENLLLQNIRTIRSITPGKQVLACVFIGVERRLFVNRAPSWEEIKWQMLAVCGGNYQGIALRGAIAEQTVAGQVRDLCEKIATQAAEISMARPIRWVRISGDAYVSALRTDRTLFVILLNPNFMNLTTANLRDPVRLPLELKRQTGELLFPLPSGLTISGGRTLAGRPLELQLSGSEWKCQYGFSGSSEMLILDLSGSTDVDLVDSLPPVQFITTPAGVIKRSILAEDLMRGNNSERDD